MSDSSMPIGSTGAGGGNMIRLTGLSSGLDVDAVVKKMMAGEQTKLDKAQQDQQTTQWKQEAYQDIIKNIKDLQSSFLIQELQIKIFCHNQILHHLL
ncbi:flagellar cap protein FliD N-terminal domain-containing protein [Clostridium ljungdahlii]|uniref:flagellar cap protein FliD N-terminal domain-containing protein n=1 Tax=Clostridium ljungdahlii TaxID=1538 RepID=UPI00386A02C0